MPQIYYLDNYCYEVNNLYLSVYKYDIFDNNYYKIDQCPINKNIPKKYLTILKDIKEHNSISQVIPQFQEIKIAS
jgi:hypothetical protein